LKGEVILIFDEVGRLLKEFHPQYVPDGNIIEYN
jgi:hypothetical protein